MLFRSRLGGKLGGIQTPSNVFAALITHMRPLQWGTHRLRWRNTRHARPVSLLAARRPPLSCFCLCNRSGGGSGGNACTPIPCKPGKLRNMGGRICQLQLAPYCEALAKGVGVGGAQPHRPSSSHRRKLPTLKKWARNGGKLSGIVKKVVSGI